MPTVRSADGTTIAFSRVGQGPPVILVDGALSSREGGLNTPLAELLGERFTVYTYDRRGRGESGDELPYSVDREIEDLAALIAEAGGSASVYGISSGAVLALDAANRGLPIDSVAVYETPFVVDDSRRPVPADYRAQLDRLLAADRRGAMVKLFMGKGVGLPGIVVALMPLMPAWKRMKAIAHTLRYDAAFMGDTQSGKPLPADRWSAVTMPTLVVGGSKSPGWIGNAVDALAAVLPNAERRTLEGQTHIVKAPALAPVLTDFFAGHDRQEDPR